MSHPQEMPFSQKDLDPLKRFLQGNPKTMILTHAGPDGDAIGSAMGLYMGLSSLGQDVSVACYDPVPEKFRFLAQTDAMVTDFDEQNYDGFFFVDCGHPKMMKFQETKERLLSDKVTKINIDHHPSNDHFGDINFVVTDAAASAEILYFLLRSLEINVSPQIATALLLGIYTDTGGFMHQNTTPRTYLAAARLAEKGGDIRLIAKHVFHRYDLKTLRLWGKVLQDLHITQEGAAIVGVEKKDYESIGATRQDLEGVIDFLNSIPQVQYSVMLSEDDKGNVKASLRTRKPEVDVKALAEKFGGGGHVKASGFTIPHGHLVKEVKWKIVQDEEASPGA